MKSKISEILTIVIVLGIFLTMALIFSFTGVKNLDYNYVKVEVNPKVEFVTTKHNRILTVYPINNEAKELLINEDFIGLNVKEGVTKFVDLCVQANYIDVEREDNAIKLTTVSGMAHVLEEDVYKCVKEYLLNNQIKSVVLEGSNDLEEFKSSKKLGVSVPKYALIESYVNLYGGSKESATKLSEKQLIKQIKIAHDENLPFLQNYTQNQIAEKTKLIDFNRAKLNNHKSKISNKSISKFKDEYKQYVISNQSGYEQNFDDSRTNWQKAKQNSAIA